MERTYKSHGEIHGQHRALLRTLEYLEGRGEELRHFFAGGGDIVFVASGSSYWMSLSAHLTFRLQTGRRTHALKAGDVLLCPEEYAGMFDAPVFVCPSRSGRTGEVLGALDHLEKLYPGAPTLSFVEYPDSPLEARSRLALSIPWANEESVCQTRSFSSLYLAAVAAAAVAGGDRHLLADLHRYLDAAPELYRRHEQAVRALLETGAPASIVCLGCGRQYGVCIEGAYIVIEMAQFNTNYYQLLEYRHGPIVTADSGTWVFLLCARGCEDHARGIAVRAAAAGARVFPVSDTAVDFGDTAFLLDGAYPREVVALHYVFCLQSLAHHLALYRGVDPDSPGQLVPYIEL